MATVRVTAYAALGFVAVSAWVIVWVVAWVGMTPAWYNLAVYSGSMQHLPSEMLTCFSAPYPTCPCRALSLAHAEHMQISGHQMQMPKMHAIALTGG